MSTSISRSVTLWTAAYFLARYGERAAGEAHSLPPRELETTSWRHAYATFFAALGAGRTLAAFQRTMKNARDCFDSHLGASGRIGWRLARTESRGDAREPLALPRGAARVLRAWDGRPREALWAAVREVADLGVAAVPAVVLDDIESEVDRNAPDARSRTEGRRAVVISARAERDPRLRAAALALHGTDCVVCGFDFGERYGDWGAGFAEVHHVRPLGGDGSGIRDTDPARDLAVLCANCHRMLHRRTGVTLTVDELRQKLRPPRLGPMAG